MAKPTSQEHLKLINETYNSLTNLMTNLYSRWLDEQKFEDIEDYGDVIEKNLPKGIIIERVTKRPFGFVFNVGTDAHYRMIINSKREYLWERIA